MCFHEQGDEKIIDNGSGYFKEDFNFRMTVPYQKQNYEGFWDNIGGDISKIDEEITANLHRTSNACHHKHG